jgi:predicted lipoprotein with Yx(FWY)xxD motif
MARSTHHPRPRRLRHLALALITVGAAASAVLVGMALAKSFVLQVAGNAKVTNTKGAVAHENIVVGSRGRAVYTLSGDSRRHPECTQANSCFQFWPPAKVSSAGKLSGAHGVKGRIGVWRRDGFIQLTLNGHPLYTYAGDSRSHVATGEGIKGFGGIWHVVKASPAHAGNTPTTSTPTTTTMTSTTSSPYPPGY